MAFDMIEAITLIAREKNLEFDAVLETLQASLIAAAKKKYKVRMAPTLIIFKDGIKETVFKAGLDLMLPADLNEIQEAVDEINTASQF